MTQVSKYPLDKNIEHEIFQRFRHSISLLHDIDDVSSFLSDFLTDTEELMLAKRFTIAVLILRGRRPKDIKAVLHVSNSATGAVSAWLKNAKPKTLKALERVIEESNWQSFLDSIDALFDKLPPRYGTDWTRAGKEKWQRQQEHISRQTLR